jgi:hypothetical protein
MELFGDTARPVRLMAFCNNAFSQKKEIMMEPFRKVLFHKENKKRLSGFAPQGGFRKIAF